MIPLLIMLPLLGGLAALVLKSDPIRRGLLVAVALAHAGLTAGCWLHRPASGFHGWLGLDALGLLFLSLTSALYVAAAVAGRAYLIRESRSSENMGSEAVFTACLLLFLATMTLVILSRHFGLLWVAVEGTTLASAPLIMFHRQERSLEATWKYLLLCSVGIALALLGTFFLAAASGATGGEAPLLLDRLLETGSRLQTSWLKAAFILLAVGYGTKMGLAPLHTWLPDAHSEAPSPVSALLSGALLNCAFLGILRVHQVNLAAGQGQFGQGILLAFGLLSLATAAVFIIGQSDFKRLLAYSSVEHMGLLAVGIGVGGAGIFGAAFHAVNHSLAKGMLFLAAGNMVAAFHTKQAVNIRGLARSLPATGMLWAAGLLAITGAPPFGTFWSEWLILRAAADAGRWGVVAAVLLLLGVVFIGMFTVMLRMTQGGAEDAKPVREGWSAVLPPAALGAAVLLLGLWVPGPVAALLKEAVGLLGGGQ